MTEITARPATQEDIINVVSPELHTFFLSRFDASESITLSFVAEGKVIAVGGIAGIPFASNGEVWVSLTQEFYRYPMAPLVMRRELRDGEEKLGFYRYQMSTKRNEPIKTRFAVWMGYPAEAVLHSYSNGEDYVMHARVRRGVKP